MTTHIRTKTHTDKLIQSKRHTIRHKHVQTNRNTQMTQTTRKSQDAAHTQKHQVSKKELNFDIFYQIS